MSSIIEQATGVIVKSDHSGRIRYTAQYKQEVVAAFESSSLSAPAFARQCGIKYPTLAAWIAAQKRGQSKPKPKNAPAFLIAEVAEQSGDPALEVRLPGGGVARASDLGQIHLLAALLRQLS
jgi:transposase-like protein